MRVLLAVICRRRPVREHHHGPLRADQDRLHGGPPGAGPRLQVGGNTKRVHLSLMLLRRVRISVCRVLKMGGA